MNQPYRFQLKDMPPVYQAVCQEPHLVQEKLATMVGNELANGPNLAYAWRRALGHAYYQGIVGSSVLKALHQQDITIPQDIVDFYHEQQTETKAS